MKSVIQQEITGGAIASFAAIAGISYPAAKKVANNLGIYAEDLAMWSETNYIRNLLGKFGIQASKREIPFSSWDSLPNCALLSIKWHMKNNKPYWHCAVFVREEGTEYVLDSKKSLIRNARLDFGRMKPKWFIEVKV
ncbi:MAG: hypothetical protein ABGZ19_01590 [Verrucomicrobiales bacterium]